MPPHEAECHSTQREKMEKVSGSPKNFESQSDKAERLCRGGYAEGGVVDFPISMQQSDARRIKSMQNPPPVLKPAPSPLLGPGANRYNRGGKV